MARKIIERYRLQERILALSAQGKRDYEVAEILNREDLSGKDSISQPTISRWLKGVRKERGQTAKSIVDDYLKESIPADLKLLDELTQFHLIIFRGRTAMIENGVKTEIGLNERRTAARDIHEILKTKMKFVGVDGDTGTGSEGDPVDLDQYRLDSDEHKDREATS